MVAREQALLQRSARPKPHWHREQAKIAESDENWFAETFHRAWISKVNPLSVVDGQALKSVYENLNKQDQAENRHFAELLPSMVKETVDKVVPLK